MLERPPEHPPDAQDESGEREPEHPPRGVRIEIDALAIEHRHLVLITSGRRVDRGPLAGPEETARMQHVQRRMYMPVTGRPPFQDHLELIQAALLKAERGGGRLPIDRPFFYDEVRSTGGYVDVPQLGIGQRRRPDLQHLDLARDDQLLALLHLFRRKPHVLPRDGLHPQEPFLSAFAVGRHHLCRAEQAPQAEEESQKDGVNQFAPHRRVPSFHRPGRYPDCDLLPTSFGSQTIRPKQMSPVTKDVIIARSTLPPDKLVSPCSRLWSPSAAEMGTSASARPSGRAKISRRRLIAHESRLHTFFMNFMIGQIASTRAMPCPTQYPAAATVPPNRIATSVVSSRKLRNVPCSIIRRYSGVALRR